MLHPLGAVLAGYAVPIALPALAYGGSLSPPHCRRPAPAAGSRRA